MILHRGKGLVIGRAIHVETWCASLRLRTAGGCCQQVLGRRQIQRFGSLIETEPEQRLRRGCEPGPEFFLKGKSEFVCQIPCRVQPLRLGGFQPFKAGSDVFKAGAGHNVKRMLEQQRRPLFEKIQQQDRSRL